MTTESQNIEFKQSWQDDYLKCICGFANAQGWRIFIGKDDSGKVIGLKNARKHLEDHWISLWNAGVLPVELTVDKLFQVHGSIRRNPLIAEVCYRVGYIDSWGRGIEKITDSCKKAGFIIRRGPKQGGHWEVKK